MLLSKKSVGALFLSSFCYLLLGCDNFKDHLDGEHNVLKTVRQVPTPVDSDSVARLSFENIKKQILEPHCINCHTGKHKSYDLFPLVQISAPDMLNRMKTNNILKRMPQNRSPLDPDLIQLFSDWIDAGMPEFESDIVVQEQDLTHDLKYSFADIKEYVFKPNNCISCHTHFEDYSVVLKNLSAIVSTIQIDKMPYPKKMGEAVLKVTQDQKAILSTWVNQGAPKVVGEMVMLFPEKLEPNWISIRNNILGPKCIMCHNGFGPRGKRDLSTYQSLQNIQTQWPKFLNSQSPEESHFIGSIIGRFDDDEFNFVSMPYNTGGDDVSNIPDLTQEEFNIILEWIGLGYPEI